jgi:hypothetical protein
MSSNADNTPIKLKGVSDLQTTGTGDDLVSSFSLVGEGGQKVSFVCHPFELKKIQTDLQLLAAKGLSELKPVTLFGKFPADVVFDIETGGVVVPAGKAYSGQIILMLKTVGGHWLATGIGANLAKLMYDQIRRAIAGLAEPPEPSESNFFDGLFVPGNQKPLQKPLESFGQEYPTEIVQELGIFMIRANLLEMSMIRLLANVAGVDNKISSALFYSTVNVRARITMIQAAVSASNLDGDLRGLITKALVSVSRVTGRRNVLVHGFWKFKSDKVEVESFEPTKSEKSQNEVITAKSLRALTADYYATGLLLEAAAEKVAEWRGGRPAPPSPDSRVPKNSPSRHGVLIPPPPPSEA